MSSNVALNVKLHSPDDWDHWENELLNQARAKDVIRILQGTEEPLKKPTNLLNDDFLTAPVAPTNPTGVNRISAAASAGRRHHNNTAIQGEDTQPTPTPDSQETVQVETMNRNDAWTTAYEITIEEKIEDGTLTRRELANAFRRNLRKIRNRRPSRVYRGSFAVQEERMDDDSDEESYHYVDNQAVHWNVSEDALAHDLAPLDLLARRRTKVRSSIRQPDQFEDAKGGIFFDSVIIYLKILLRKSLSQDGALG
uniref:Spectrin beta chain, non-erythrocytic 2 n=1 Tax=Talaromyces marneffei PM1 TaxID=1077442 RepID=A0A093X688_TALMA